MSEASTIYHQENALMFSRLEELAGKVEGRIAKVKSYEKKIIGLEFELNKTKEEKDELKKRLSFLKRQKDSDKTKVKELDELEAQNFTIRNKIAKIVVDIENREVSDEDVKELMQTMISEIDDCIRLLQ